MGQGRAVTLVHFCLSTLELGFGRYEDARVHALKVFEADLPYVCSMALGDMIEATATPARRLYQEVLEQLGRSGVVTELARSHLLYGEWLRRQRRRRDARAGG
jgi:hypothetical protein